MHEVAAPGPVRSLKKRWLKPTALGALGLLLLAGGWAVAHVVRKHGKAPVAEQEPEVVASKLPRSTDIALSIYDGKLADGWSDWGWGPHELPASAGPAKIKFTGYGGVILRHDPVTLSYGGLFFRYKAPADWPEFLAVSLKSGNNTLPKVSVDADAAPLAPDGWREVWVGMDQLNPESLPFDRIVISARTSVSNDWVLLDKVGLTRGDARAAQLAASQRPIALSILCAEPTHPISPLIYGSALGDWESGQSAQRIGGNPTTRANWDLGVWNIANDWFFENVRSSDNNELIDTAATHGARTALTVPMIGWVSKDESSVGFPRSKFPEQRKFDSQRPAAGDGLILAGDAGFRLLS